MCCENARKTIKIEDFKFFGTRGPQLGRLMLYQLSYSRLCTEVLAKAYKPSLPALATKVVNAKLSKVGREGFEPPKAYASRFTVCPSWPLWYLPFSYYILTYQYIKEQEPMEGVEPTTC